MKQPAAVKRLSDGIFHAQIFRLKAS